LVRRLVARNPADPGADERLHAQRDGYLTKNIRRLPDRPATKIKRKRASSARFRG
jgi:hypothetical protein